MIHSYLLPKINVNTIKINKIIIGIMFFVKFVRIWVIGVLLPILVILAFQL